MFELFLILALLVLNGLFAMTEIAIVSARRTRLKARAEEGDKGAAAALRLAEEPTRFLSTVQIGITLTGIVAGAFGGSTLSSEFARVLEPFLGQYAERGAFIIVIVGITYFSLVLGELVPKRLAMIRPESISGLMARPMEWISAAAGPAVQFLGWSTERALRLMGVKEDGAEERGVSKDEVSVLVREGLISGAFQQAEGEMVESVLELARLDVADIMTPRQQIVWLQEDAQHADVWHRIATSNHLFFPIYKDEPDSIVGYISIKTLYCQLAAEIPVHLADLMRPPLIVPEHSSAIKLLETFRQKRVHVAFAVNEFGGVEGMVTLSDVLEAIVGDVPSREERTTAGLTLRDDGSWLADGLMEIEKVVASLPEFPEPPREDHEFHTLAGFFITRFEGVPKEGEHVDYSGWRLEVVDMDGFRVDKVLLTPLRPMVIEEEGPEPQTPPHGESPD